MKQIMKKWGAPILAVFTATAFLPVFLYCQNTDEANFSEIILPLLLFLGVGFGCMAVFTWWIRSPAKAALIAILFALIVENFAFLERMLRVVVLDIKYWHTVPLVLVVGLHIAYILWRFLPEELAADSTKILDLVFGGLLIFNLATSAPQMIGRMQAQREIRVARQLRQEQRMQASADQPNIYLFIFDEYANFPQMEEYYHYGNALLREFLEDNRFAISYTSHNESIVSATIQTNLVNLDYVVDGTFTASEREAFRKNGALFKLMPELGYCVQIFETGDFYGGQLPSGGRNKGGVTINGETLFHLLMQRSIIYPAVSIEGEHVIDDILEIVEYLSAPENLPMGSTFTLTYLNFPHQPFLVDENGEAVPAEHMIDWEDDQYYLGQYKYATKLMIQMLENILQNDPGATIILQSDHGARARASDLFGKKFPMEAMTNPLNAVYIQGRKFGDIEGLSSVNTLRFVLNELFDLGYEMLPVPQSTNVDFLNND